MKLQRLAVIGVGLIGGSLARALRTAGAVEEIVGAGRRIEHLQQAVDLGVIDRAAVSVADAVRGADAVVLAVPVAGMEAVLRECAGAVSPQVVLTDVGSVKGSVIRAARETLGPVFGRFVPGHPVAGTERSGVAASFAGLFEDHKIILTPEPDTDRDAVDTVRALWEQAGGQVVEMGAAHHDRVLAACSHLPHVLAYTLVDMLVRRDDHREIFEYAAGGFRDFTRIASSDPDMWRDICLANREPLLALLKQYRLDLKRLMDAVEKGDARALHDTFQRAKHARDRYTDPKKKAP